MTVRKGRKAPKQSNPAPAALDLEDFRYADELGLVLPQLVLGIEIPKRGFDEDARMPQFKPGRTWTKLAHQTAGHACHQRYLICTGLSRKLGIVQGTVELNQKWLDSQAGCFGVSLGTAVEYNADLHRLFGAGCNLSHRDFEEGFYPIDVEFLPWLASDILPKDLDELIEWRNGFERIAGSIGRWKLVILGENSD